MPRRPAEVCSVEVRPFEGRACFVPHWWTRTSRALITGRTNGVLPVYRYEELEPLLATLAEKVIAPAEGKVKALAERRLMIEAELTKPQ